jgi:hypothetical protein
VAVDRDVRDYGVVLDGTTDCSAQMQAAVNDVAATGGGVLRAPAGVIKATGLTWASKVVFQGALGQDSDSTSGTCLLGTSGSDTITLPSSGNHMGFQSLAFIGGRDQIVTTDLTYESFIKDCVFSGPSRAGFHVPGTQGRAAIERWQVENVYFSGGQYGWLHDYVGATALNCYMDKMLFEKVLCAGQSINGWNIQVVSANSNTWLRCGTSHAAQTGFVLKGGLRSTVLIDMNTEANGKSGKNLRTTGSITSGSTVLTVTAGAGAGFTVGDPIVVAAAGNSGADLYATLADKAGDALTLTGGASRTVNNAAVTNASYDDFEFGSSGGGAYTPAGITFVGGVIGGETSVGRLRYAINASNCFGVACIGTGTGTVHYDPNRCLQVFGGSGGPGVRRPPLHNGDLWRFSTFAPPGIGEFFRTLVASPAGGDTILGLRDSLETANGTFGGVEVRTGDPNKTLLFRVDGNTQATTARRLALSSAVTITGATPSVTSTNRVLTGNGSPTTITGFTGGVDGQLLYLRAGDPRTTVANNGNIVTKSGGSDPLSQGAVRTYYYDASALRWYET